MSQRKLDDNDLARFLELETPEEKRGSTLTHLADSDEDLEVLGDAAYLLDDLEDEGVRPEDGAETRDAGGNTGPKAVPLPPPSMRRGWRRAPARWLALAAMIAGVLLVPLALSRSGGPGGPGEFAALLQDGGAGLPAGWDQHPWPVTRSAGDPLTDTDVGRAARLGALWVDLELAAASGNAEDAGILCAKSAAVLAEVPAGGAVGLDCARLVPPAGPETPALRETGRALAAHFEHEPHFAVGAFAEAGRLAALNQDAGFFASRRSRKALDRFAASDELTPAVRESAERVRDRLRTGGAPDWAALKADLDALLVTAHHPASVE